VAARGGPSALANGCTPQSTGAVMRP